MVACHMWAMATGFHAVQRQWWPEKGKCQGKKGKGRAEKKGKEEKGADRWGWRRSE